MRILPTCPSGGERFGDREPVGWAFGEDSEDGELGQRQLMAFPQATLFEGG